MPTSSEPKANLISIYSGLPGLLRTKLLPCAAQALVQDLFSVESVQSYLATSRGVKLYFQRSTCSTENKSTIFLDFLLSGLYFTMAYTGPDLCSLEPARELAFDFSKGGGGEQKLKIRNNSSEQAIAFKVKTTAPKAYLRLGKSWSFESK